MFAEATSETDRQSQIQHVTAEGRENVAPCRIRNETGMAPSKGLHVCRRRVEVLDIHTCIEPARLALWSALASSCDTTLIAPAFRKLAEFPLAHHSGWPTPAYSP